ncbi:tyrosine-type recombinase/integrase [Aureitalea marina]|uniref:Tyrosine recombinase XerC n=1 Tax=Aureitalea marina TaxID=930804 RepID=A0A2S7KQC6_9FLAO|nr:tyrosine-type recombinase/integrase [Aureitalea marina]PQB04825.1 integrase [Aureitalea marina]
MSQKAFIEFLDLEKNYSPHTVLAYRRDLELFSDFIQDTDPTLGLEKVNYSLIRNWIVHLVDSGISNRSINRKISSLKAYYRFLLKTGSIDQNPLARHKALKTAVKLQVPFSKEEMQEVMGLLNAEAGFKGTRNRLMVELFYATGMRRAELVNLQLRDISRDTKSIKVLGKRSKERIIPLLPAVFDSLNQYLKERSGLESIQDESYLFLSEKGRKIYESLVYRVINSYFSTTSEKVKRSPHILRHTFATHLLNEGADLNAVKELLGHASLASTQVYTHNSIAQLKSIHKKAHPRNSED